MLPAGTARPVESCCFCDVARQLSPSATLKDEHNIIIRHVTVSATFLVLTSGKTAVGPTVA